MNRNKNKLKKYLATVILAVGLIWSSSFLIVQAQANESFLNGQICSPDADAVNSKYNLARCVNNIYTVSLAIGGFYAVLIFVVAGYMYAFGNEKSVKTARELITSTVIGLILLFGAYAILNTIDPRLTTFEHIVMLPEVNCDDGACELPEFEHTTDGPLGPETPGGLGEGAAGVIGDCKSFTSKSAAEREQTTIRVSAWKVGPGGNGRVTHGLTFPVQKCLETRVVAAFMEIYNDPEKFPILTAWGYNWRNTSSGTRSNHSYGIALDINEDYNGHYRDGNLIGGGAWKPCNPDATATTCYRESIRAGNSVVRAFNRQGFGWGGDWRSSKDYMHFSCAKLERGNGCE